MDPLLDPPASAKPKRKPRDMSSAAVERRADATAKRERTSTLRNETEELVEAISEVYAFRAEDIIRNDNKRAFEIILRNRNHPDLQEPLSDCRLVELLLRHDATECMTTLQPYDKYNRHDHLQSIPVDLVMDPDHREIVAGFLWSRNSNVLEYSDRIGGQERQRITDIQFRVRSLVALLKRPGTTLQQRLSFLQAMMQRIPFEQTGKPATKAVSTPCPDCTDEAAHMIDTPAFARVPSKHEKMLNALWDRFADQDDPARDKAEAKLYAYTAIEALSDEVLMECKIDLFAHSYRHNVQAATAQQVLRDRASALHRTVDPVLRALGFEEAHLATLVCSYLNPQIDPKVHLGAKKHPKKHSRKLYRAARAEEKQRKADAKKRKAERKRAAAAAPAEPMELIDADE